MGKHIQVKENPATKTRRPDHLGKPYTSQGMYSDLDKEPGEPWRNILHEKWATTWTRILGNLREPMRTVGLGQEGHSMFRAAGGDYGVT